MTKQFDILKQIFSLNGLRTKGIVINMKNPSTLAIKVENNTATIAFEKGSYPKVAVKKEVGIFGRKMEFGVDREITAIIATPEKIKVMVKNFPDFDFTYEELGV